MATSPSQRPSSGRPRRAAGPLAPGIATVIAIAIMALPAPENPSAAPGLKATRHAGVRSASSPREAGVAGPTITSEPDGPTFARIGGGHLKIQICADHIVRVVYGRSADVTRDVASRPTLATAARRCLPAPSWRLGPRVPGSREAIVTTPRLNIHVDLESGKVGFHERASDRPILVERGGIDGRTLVAATVRGEATSHVRQQWEPNGDEALYGLGQHQQELLDIKDHDLALRQYNTEIYIPFLVSSRGYGILWDNTSFTRFGDLAAAVPLPNVRGLYPRFALAAAFRGRPIAGPARRRRDPRRPGRGRRRARRRKRRLGRRGHAPP